MQLEEGIWKYFSGRERMDVGGVNGHALVQLKEGIWKYFNGHERMGASGIGTTCSSAAREGNLEVLQWARENGCEWDGTCALVQLEEGI